MTIRLPSGFGSLFFGNGTLHLAKTSAAAPAASPASRQTARDQFSKDVSAFVAALRGLTSTSQPIYRSLMVGGRSTPATVVGSAVAAQVVGRPSTIQATSRVNTTSDTSRTSASALGLDLSPAAVSVLSSAQLGLDLTSPSRASTLESSSAIGLDTTSPTAHSVVTSSSAIGLDLTSPDAPSTLASAQQLSLDVASPERASTLDSASLGLDLTSPAAASVLTSSATLGLDMTSPETASQLQSSAGLGLDITSPERASVLSSSSALGLDVTSPEVASTITSMAAVNTATSTYAPNVVMSSGTSAATLSGTFNGVGTAASMSTLTIKSMANATLGSTAANVHFQVLDQNSTKLLDYSGSLKAGDKIYLGDDIGLYVSFSAGTMVNNGAGSSTITRTRPTVDPTAAFNAGDPNLRPRFDNGARVTAGSFTINGTSIAVNAGDSINSVISTINASSAGVTASFANGKMTLTTSTASEDQISLANDTSGFLAAMKLVSPNQEINSATTSYASNTLKFSLGSSVATLSGTYLGVGDFAGATTLNVKIQTLVGSLSTTTANSLKFQVLDQSNKTLFSFNGSAKAGDKIAIGNDSGLWISFSAGSLIANDTASTTVSNTVKTDVDPNAVFNDSNANARPRFENGAVVTAGSFTVNGTSVAVNANDSINTVLARINATVSGVTAAFANDRITVTNTATSTPAVLGNDTSGFLAATKLAQSVTVHGNVRDDQQVLSKTMQFAGVTNGSFSINGTSIAVNATTDSLSSIIARINASSAGVTAAYDAANDRVVLTSNANTEDLISISDDTSGFATAARLASANTVRGNVRDDQQVLAKTTQFGAVTNGSFTINGTTIGVNAATDTLTSIIARINASSAGVTASFDATANRLQLVGNADSEDLIAVGDDTSGFLTAAKLATANTVRGNLRDDRQVLAKTTQFGAVSNGSFSINGVAISVDTATDSLSSVIARINASAAGVTASYDTAADRLVLTGQSPSEDLITVAGDSTGFLSAAHLATANTVRGHLAEDGVPLYDLSRFSSVTSGSFVVDGKTIAVSTGDSIQSIVSRINASGARVTASFDATTNKLHFTTADATEDLVGIGSDTSGFLAAAGIDAANTARGNIRDDQQVLAKTTQFGAVASGTFSINGVQIAVDRNVDSLSSIIARIDGAGAGVTAEYDATNDVLRLTGTSNSEDLIDVGSDSTGFLSAAHLATANTTRGHLAEDTVALSDLTPFAGVSNGSFAVDGKTIAVSTGDTMQSIVSKINASGARVTAAYDATADRLRLETTFDTEDRIDVGNDTSGFLAAAHVDAADTVAGNLRDDQQVLAKTTQFGSVQSGTFTMNGATISVDAATDSVASIVDRINRSNAGVTAAYDAAADRVTLAGTTSSEDLIDVGNDTTGFLSAAHLAAANTVRGNIPDDQQVLAKTSQFGNVVAGTMIVDGVAVNVDPLTDSVATIVSRINGLNLSVVASYDPLVDRILLTRTTADEDPIPLGADTSGLLAQMQLDPANTVLGNLPDDQQVLNRTTQFSSVQAGSFSVNGHSIAIDPASDTLESVVSRVNASGAGVTARYDAAADRLTIAPNVAGATLDVEDDTSGFLAAAHVAQGTVGSTLNTSASFDQTGANAPMFDPGLDVHAGSFTVNGVRIDVASNDSVDSVLAKITSSRAGVTAAFDAQSQTVSLTSKASSVSPITLGSDDSGFLRAVKLDASAVSTSGTAGKPGYAAPVSDVRGFAAVHAGTLSVNGHSIAIDPRTTTLRSLAGALSNAGVTASLDENAGTFTLTPANGGDLDLSDTSGVLSALGIAQGHYAGGHQDGHRVRVPVGAQTVSNASKVAADVQAAASTLNFAFTQFGVTADDQSAHSAAKQFAAVGQLFKTFGIDGLTVQSQAGSAMKLNVDVAALTKSLDTQAGSLTTLLKTGSAFSTGLEQSFQAFANAAAMGATSATGSALSDLVDQLKAKSATAKTSA